MSKSLKYIIVGLVSVLVAVYAYLGYLYFFKNKNTNYLNSGNFPEEGVVRYEGELFCSPFIPKELKNNTCIVMFKHGSQTFAIKLVQPEKYSLSELVGVPIVVSGTMDTNLSKFSEKSIKSLEIDGLILVDKIEPL